MAALARLQVPVTDVLTDALPVGELVVLGNAHNELQPVFFQILEPRMVHELPVPDHQANPVPPQHQEAKIQQADAVCRVRIAAPMVQ